MINHRRQVRFRKPWLPAWAVREQLTLDSLGQAGQAELLFVKAFSGGDRPAEISVGRARSQQKAPGRRVSTLDAQAARCG